MSDGLTKFFAIVFIALIFALIISFPASGIQMLTENSTTVGMHLTGSAETNQFIDISETPVSIKFVSCGGEKFILAVQGVSNPVKGEYVKPASEDDDKVCWEKTINEFQGQIHVIRGPVDYSIVESTEPPTVHVYFDRHAYWKVFWQWFFWSYIVMFVICLISIANA